MTLIYTYTSFFCNKCNTDLAERNYHYYNKKGIKLSINTDSRGAILHVKIN
jgi:hypothetical protein